LRCWPVKSTTDSNMRGSAFLTVSRDERDRFWNAMERLGRTKPALPVEKRKRARWVEPVLRVKVEYLRAPGRLRHATVREVL
jgi:hypothetical protein